MQEMQVRSLGREDPLEKEMQPILGFLPGKSHGQRTWQAIVHGGLKRARHDLATKQQQSVHRPFVRVSIFSPFGLAFSCGKPDERIQVDSLNLSSLMEKQLEGQALLIAFSQFVSESETAIFNYHQLYGDTENYGKNRSWMGPRGRGGCVWEVRRSEIGLHTPELCSCRGLRGQWRLRAKQSFAMT